jgi:uncharacterized protein (TIRG00374 family)
MSAISGKLLRKSIHFILFASIGVFTFWLIAKNQSMSELKAQLANARYEFVLLSFVAAFITYLSRAMRWKILIEPLGYNVKLRNVFAGLMTGYLANFLFPRIGEITRCGVLAKKEDIPTDKLIGTVILERAFDLVMLIVFILVLFIAKYDTFGTFITSTTKTYVSKNIGVLNPFHILLIILLVTLLVVAASLIFRRFRRTIIRNRIILKFRRVLKGITQGFKTVMRLRRNTEFIIHTLIMWAMYWFMMYIVCFALPETSILKPIDGLFLMVMGGIGMSLPVQGGIGTFHAAIALSLTLYGIDSGVGFGFAVLVHESQLIFGIALGLASLILLYISKRKSKT